MRSRTPTIVLAALALVLAVVLTVVLLQRPSGPSTVDESPTAAPTVTAAPPVSSAPAATPTPVVTDPAQEGGPSTSLPTNEVDNDATPGATPYAQTSAARAEWEPIATGFGKAFTQTDGKKAAAWRASLEPYVTVALAKQLANADPKDVPEGTFVAIEPEDFGEDKVTVLLQYDSGLTLAAYLIQEGNGWKVYDYDRNES